MTDKESIPLREAVARELCAIDGREWSDSEPKNAADYTNADLLLAVVVNQAAEQIKALNMRAPTSGWLSVNDVLAVLDGMRGTPFIERRMLSECPLPHVLWSLVMRIVRDYVPWDLADQVENSIEAWHEHRKRLEAKLEAAGGYEDERDA